MSAKLDELNILFFLLIYVLGFFWPQNVRKVRMSAKLDELNIFIFFVNLPLSPRFTTFCSTKCYRPMPNFTHCLT